MSTGSISKTKTKTKTKKNKNNYCFYNLVLYYGYQLNRTYVSRMCFTNLFRLFSLFMFII